MFFAACRDCRRACCAVGADGRGGPPAITPSDGGERFLQLPGIHWYAIRGRILLEAPSFRERAGINDIEPELVEEIGDHLLRG
jgi:hypothetical protein